MKRFYIVAVLSLVFGLNSLLLNVGGVSARGERISPKSGVTPTNNPSLKLQSAFGSSNNPRSGGSTGSARQEEPSQPKCKDASVSPGKTLSGPHGIKFVEVPPGSFCMGSEGGDGDEKLHRVRISRSFQIGKYEVTQAQWQRVTGKKPSYFKNCPECPVEQVSWDDAQVFIASLNSGSDGYIYRLPTEAEWEYACRAGTTGEYTGSLPDMGWFGDNSEGKTHPVGQKRPNGFGLYDMHGNVWEWCQDFLGPYAAGSAVDPAGPTSGSKRVHRGGGWGSPAVSCQSAHRHSVLPSLRGDFLGFRLVRTHR